MSENNVGAGGKGTSGYWGSSTDEAKEAAFEAHYRQLIPKGLYKTHAHNPLTCGLCTNERQTLFYCAKGGLGFGGLPIVKVREGEYRLERCGLCGEVRSRRKVHHKKRSKNLSSGENPSVEGS